MTLYFLYGSSSTRSQDQSLLTAKMFVGTWSQALDQGFSALSLRSGGIDFRHSLRSPRNSDTSRAQDPQNLGAIIPKLGPIPRAAPKPLRQRLEPGKTPSPQNPELPKRGLPVIGELMQAGKDAERSTDSRKRRTRKSGQPW